VFKVVTAGRVGVLSGVVSSDAPSLVDGSYLTWWDNKGVLPATVTLDLGAAKPVAYLGVNQREWSVSYARSSTEDSARIRDYTVETSLDGVTWTPAVAATMKSARGVQFIDLGVASARYVRLTVNTTWAAQSATKYSRKLQIDELWAASSYA
jgi:alpha-L-fucosidase